MRDGFDYSGENFQYDENLFRGGLGWMKKQRIRKRYGKMWYEKLENEIKDITDSKELIKYLKENGVLPYIGSKIRFDPRTKNAFFRFLRKMSLDETPQIGAVLKGRLLIVGFRPAVSSLFDENGYSDEARIYIERIKNACTQSKLFAYMPYSFIRSKSRTGDIFKKHKSFGLTKDERETMETEYLKAEAEAIEEFERIYNDAKTKEEKLKLQLRLLAKGIYYMLFNGHRTE
ncbi:MAG: hypothetical protein GXO64_03510 [Candidatus Micrarchaeota archaeon]|nr:hypothetical protein [Candidatus Micrarchaeota archaeon]